VCRLPRDATKFHENVILDHEWSCRGVTRVGFLVSPGAATESVTPIYSGKTYYLFLLISPSCHFYRFHSGVTPRRGYHPPPSGGCHFAPFSPVRPRLSTILCKFTHKIILWVNLQRVSPGVVCPSAPLVTPLWS